MARLRITLVFMLAIGCLLLTNSCRANLLGEAYGIVTDPLKLAKGSQNILDSVIRVQGLMKDLDSMEVRTNKDISDRLMQVKGITDQVIAAVDRNVAVAVTLVDQMNQLEKDIFARAEGLIEKARCLVANTMDELDTELKRAALTLKTANPRITLLGIPIINLTTSEVKIDDPWQGYLSIANFHLAEIQKLTDTSPAREFLHHYGEIVRLGKRAQCAYEGTSGATWLEQMYVIPYSELQDQWITVVHPM